MLGGGGQSGYVNVKDALKGGPAYAGPSSADGFAQAGSFGDFYFGGSGAGIQQPGSSWQAVLMVAVIVLGFITVWKIR